MAAGTAFIPSLSLRSSKHNGSRRFNGGRPAVILPVELSPRSAPEASRWLLTGRSDYDKRERLEAAASVCVSQCAGPQDADLLVAPTEEEAKSRSNHAAHQTLANERIKSSSVCRKVTDDTMDQVSCERTCTKSSTNMSRFCDLPLRLMLNYHRTANSVSFGLIKVVLYFFYSLKHVQTC